MKNYLKRAAALLLCITLTLCLASCGKKSDGSDADVETVTAANLAAQAVGLKTDDVVLTVDGSDVTFSEMLYYIYSEAANAGYDMSSEIDWSAEKDGSTVGEYVLDKAVETAKLYHTVQNKADEYDVSLTSDDESDMSENRDSAVEYYGGESGYQQALQSLYLNDDLYRYAMSVSYLYKGLFSNVYGENGEKCSDEEAIAFGNDNGFYRAKHILLSATDADGNALTQEAYAAQYDKLSGILAQLDSSADPVALFDELVNEYSEDPGKSNYPDGYQYTSGTMVSEFENAVAALDDYGYSQIVEMSYGYTIVMRLPLEPDTAAMKDTYGYSLRLRAAMSNFDALLSSWTDEAQVVYAPGFNKIDLAKCF